MSYNLQTIQENYVEKIHTKLQFLQSSFYHFSKIFYFAFNPFLPNGSNGQKSDISSIL